MFYIFFNTKASKSRTYFIFTAQLTLDYQISTAQQSQVSSPYKCYIVCIFSYFFLFSPMHIYYHVIAILRYIQFVLFKQVNTSLTVIMLQLIYIQVVSEFLPQPTCWSFYFLLSNFLKLNLLELIRGYEHPGTLLSRRIFLIYNTVRCFIRFTKASPRNHSWSHSMSILTPFTLLSCFFFFFPIVIGVCVHYRKFGRCRKLYLTFFNLFRKLLQLTLWFPP